MKTTLKEFLAYIEQLAANHADIHHTPKDPAFFAFYAGENIENKLRSLITRVPCIVVKDYDFRFQDNGADNVHKVRSVDVYVLDQLGRNTSLSDVYDVWEATEEIGDELVMRMKHDKSKRLKPIINFNLNDVNALPVDITVASLYGTMYNIPFGSVRSNDPDPDKWTDL